MIEGNTGFKQPVAGRDECILITTQPDTVRCCSQPLDVNQLKATVHQCIGESLFKVEEQLRMVLASRHQSVQSLVRTALSMGGKRLRPMLTLLSSQAATAAENRPSSRDQADLIRIATAVELVHTASLAHDDVMDHADDRRHHPTICNLAGNSAAILLGDFLFTKAYDTAARCRSPLVARQIAAASTGLCEGELRQQLSSRNWQLSIREYYSILIQKTASLCSTSCRLGAWQVGAPFEQQQALRTFGKLLGLAFQIFDDWLDYWGDAQTGKTLGTDLAQRKPTLPLLHFLSSANPQGRHQLLDLLSSDKPDHSVQVNKLIRQSDSGELTLATARKLSLQAIDQLSVLPESAARSAMEQIAIFSVERSV